MLRQGLIFAKQNRLIILSRVQDMGDDDVIHPDRINDKISAKRTSSIAKVLISWDQAIGFGIYANGLGGVDQFVDEGHGPKRTIFGNIIADLFKLSLRCR